MMSYAISMVPLCVFFSCLTIIPVFEVSARTRETIGNVVRVVNTDDKNIKSVKFFDEYEYKIVHDATASPDQTIDKVDAFHSAISCHFGEWTSSRLFGIVQNLPLFYQRKFAGTVYDKTFASNYSGTFRKDVEDLDAKLKIFTDIFYTFTENNGDVAYYNDTAVPVALLSLSAKIYHVLLSQNRNTDAGAFSPFNKSDELFIRETLEEMNAVQTHLSTNCPTKNSTSENSNFYGYATNLKIDQSTDQLLEKLGKHEFVTRPEYCSIAHMISNELLGQIIPDHEDVVSGARFIIANGNRIKIPEILDRYDQTYDIELLYLYQNAVVNLIMKQIYLHMISIDFTEVLSAETKRMILEINGQISDNSVTLPDKFVEGFKLLINGRAFENDKETLKTYYGSIDDVELSASGVEFMDVQPSDEYLGKMLTNIKDRLSDFACLGRYFKILRNHYDDYYVPFAKDTSKLSVADRDSVTNKKKCNFLFYMYLNTYKIVIFSNRSIDTEQSPSEQTQYLDNTFMAMDFVKKHFVMVNKHLAGDGDVGLVKMARNIMATLENQNRPTTVPELYHVKRIVNLIMAEMNEYGLKNCTLPDFNYLLFNNTNFIELKNNSVAELFGNRVGGYSSESVIDFASSITEQDYRCYNYKFVYETYVKPYSEAENYQITFYWEGRQLNVQEIFEAATSLFSNPRHLYEMYDIFFKHILAKIYLELKAKHSSWKTNGSSDSNDPCEQSSVMPLMTKSFPLQLRSLWEEIASFWINLLELNNDDYDQRFNKIEQRFKSYNTFIRQNSSPSKLKKKSKPPKYGKIVASIENAKNVFDCHLTIVN